MDGARALVGMFARGVFWLCVWDIVVNAITQAVSAKQYAVSYTHLTLPTILRV